VAEIGASFLCAETGILPQTISNNAAYIDNWLRVLENNRSFIFRAASAAQKAADYITGGGNPAFF
jgi:antirestriction protein ArdC